jgi:M6 family metalloprotease-like protein
VLGASHSQVVRTIPFLIAVCFLALPAHAQYSGGSGTANDPYQIATAPSGVVGDCYSLASSDGDGPDNEIGIRLTSTQMKQQVRFSGSDFRGIDADGMSDLSFIPADTYPDLAWPTEVTALPAIPGAAGWSLDGARAASSHGQSPQIISRCGAWTIEPFQPGFSLLEPNSLKTYGYDYPQQGIAHFPDLPVRGSVTIPVFLVDWSDFNPVTDLSNKNNPNSVFPGYVRKHRAELEQYLNATNGLAAYFTGASGGQLEVRFQVFPWIVSNESLYLASKAVYYYADGTGHWIADYTRLAKDVLRAAVVDLGVDLTQFDADGNLVLDGFVIVYEGQPGALSGTNLNWTQATWFCGALPRPALDNVAALVPTDDPYYALFQSQNILFSRYCNLPEQYPTHGANAPGEFISLATWAHEIGHLLLGYRDYYYSTTDLGNYALSARTGDPRPFHPAALEKWLFAKWIEAPIISDVNTYVLANHHLKTGETYATNAHYLYRILINGDPYHYLTLENRYFLPASQGGSQFNEDFPGHHPESGVVIFEVNLHLTSEGQINRLLPTRCQGSTWTENIGAFQPGDTLDYVTNGFHVTIGQFSPPGPQVTFEVGP